MLIYEKDNKLNINFDNEISENPDLQIKKEDGKTSVTVDGQQGAGGVSFVIHMSETTMDSGTKYELDKTWQEISDAIEAGMYCCVVGYQPDEDSDEMVPYQLVISGVSTSEGSFCLAGLGDRTIRFSADTKDGYPYDFGKVIMPGDMETPDPGIAN